MYKNFRRSIYNKKSKIKKILLLSLYVKKKWKSQSTIGVKKLRHEQVVENLILILIFSLSAFLPNFYTMKMFEIYVDNQFIIHKL